MTDDLRRNRYPGINPHLNSLLQHETGWQGFHVRHLAQIGDALEAALPPAYYVADEESLQIGTYDPAEPVRRTRPDIVIYRTGEAESIPSQQAETSTPTLVMPVIEADEEEEIISSLVIYSVDGRPVTRIELLSPANKPPGSHAEAYRDKRRDTLRAGLRLVEIDYLHARAPVDERLPSYVDGDPGATPYAIIVSDPRPSLKEGEMRVYGFGMLEPLPVIDIPLDGSDTVRLDFGTLYQQTFSSRQLFYEIRTDYTKEPAAFDTFRPDDQALIRTFMAAIAETD